MDWRLTDLATSASVLTISTVAECSAALNTLTSRKTTIVRSLHSQRSKKALNASTIMRFACSTTRPLVNDMRCEFDFKCLFFYI